MLWWPHLDRVVALMTKRIMMLTIKVHKLLVQLASTWEYCTHSGVIMEEYGGIGSDK